MTDKELELLQQASTLISAKRKTTSKYLNQFLFFCDPQDNDSSVLIQDVTTLISRDFACETKEVSLPELQRYSSALIPNSIVIFSIGVDSRRIEWFRSLLKEVFWQRHRANITPRTYADVKTASENTKVKPFRLSDYGLFVPYIVKKRRTIRVHSFQHHPFYRYRLCTNKTHALPAAFSDFLSLLFEDCPNHLYQASGFRASQQRFKLNTHITHTRQHEIIELAQRSLDFTRFKSRHENVANYLLENDPKSIACEIPVWMEEVELSDFYEMFHTHAPLTGHIDLLCYEDEKIVVWDYKPKARREITAATQVFLYALMLSIRTGIRLKQFLCGYFDERDCYTFEPYSTSLGLNLA